jgi:hypothetical protein
MIKKWRSLLVAVLVAAGIVFTSGAPAYATYTCGTYGAGGYGTEAGCTPATTPKTTTGSSSNASSATDPTDDNTATTDSDISSPVTQKDDQPTTIYSNETEGDETSGEVSLGYLQLSLSAFAILCGIGLLLLVLKRRRRGGTSNDI